MERIRSTAYTHIPACSDVKSTEEAFEVVLIFGFCHLESWPDNQRNQIAIHAPVDQTLSKGAYNRSWSSLLLDSSLQFIMYEYSGHMSISCPDKLA